MSYGTNTSGVISSDSTDPIDVPVNNNGQNAIPILLVDLYWYQGQIDLDIRETD